jgi:hypothetical protein
MRGEVQFQMACNPRLDYGRAKQQVKLLSEKEALFIPDCGERSISPIRLRAEMPLVIRQGRVEYTRSTRIAWVKSSRLHAISGSPG